LIGANPRNSWGKIEKSADASEAHHKLLSPSENAPVQNPLETEGTKSGAGGTKRLLETVVNVGRAPIRIGSKDTPCVSFLFIR
jgi:hypothetical protein